MARKWTKRAYDKYLQTPKWRKIANKVKALAGWRCMLCNSPNYLNAHHRSYTHLGDEENHLNDLVCLCRECHKEFHKGPVHPPIKNGWPKHLREAYASRICYPLPDTVVLTGKLLKQMKTNKGFTSATYEALGVDIKNNKGWSKSLIGMEFPKAVIYEALCGRYKYTVPKPKNWRTLEARSQADKARKASNKPLKPAMPAAKPAAK